MLSTLSNSIIQYSQKPTIFSVLNTSLREAAQQKKQANFGTFPKLPCTLDHLGTLFRSTFLIYFFYHPAHSEGSRVEFMRYEK